MSLDQAFSKLVTLSTSTDDPCLSLPSTACYQARAYREQPHGLASVLLSRPRNGLRLPISSHSGVPDKTLGGARVDVDDIARAWWEREFEFRFLKDKGTAFQELFCSIMELGYPGDFQRVRPWGNVGDKKNDGYLRSRGMLFAVYGPNEMRVRQAIEKIDSDFNGALPHWHQYFDTWVFVHNSRDGLGPDITQKLGELDNGHPVAVLPWGYAELRLELFALPGTDVAVVLGSAPTIRTMQRIRMEELQPLIDQLGRQPAAAEPDLRPVSPDKLNFNLLSSSVAALLRAGMTKADLVAQYFTYHHDPTYRDEVAEKFRLHYQGLRARSFSPDRIFDELRYFVGVLR
jgi:hypothetical protein